MKTAARNQGFSLIELVLVIVIIVVATVGIMAAYRLNILGAADNVAITTATRVAQERMEIILAQRRAVGFAAFVDICDSATPPAVCPALPAGYTIAVPTIAAVDANTKHITVEASFSGARRAQLVSRVSNH